VTLRDVIVEATARLAAAGVASARHDAEVLASHLLGVGRGELPLQPDPGDSFGRAYTALVDRRAQREPLQHITGEAHFRHITLRVGQGVFVPRPETELTAGVAIDAARAVLRHGAAPVVVDLYAGSGAIAISVASEVPGAIVHAVEASDHAEPWLRRNVADWTADARAARTARAAETTASAPAALAPFVGSATEPIRGRLVAHHADVDGCEAGVLRSLVGDVDIVVANPPYVPLGADIRDPEVVEHDPAAALWSGADGLDAMRVLERTAARLLRPGGTVIAEHADVQGEAAPAVFLATGHWTDVADHHDLTGRPRYLTASLS
jgi:release factor glutamine methyltransferase